MMKSAVITILVLFSCVLVAFPVNATLIGVSGPLSSDGFPAQIIAAPPDVTEDAAFNQMMQGFDEQQNVILPFDIMVDSGMILAGTVVSSHMIFLNSGPGNDPRLLSHRDVEWTFDSMILGVMSDRMGSLEVASSGILGAIGTLYPALPHPARGMEGGDGYTISGSKLIADVDMGVTEPGDWIRVITAAIPAPNTMLLLGSGLVGIGTMRKKFRKK